MPNVRVLKHPSDEERARVIHVLTKAFWDHILIVNVLGGDLSLIEPCMAASTYLAEHAGEIHVVSGNPDKPEDIDGVALWFPPGTEFAPTEESGWFDLASKVAPDIAAWWEPLFASQDVQIEELFGKTASRDSWYLSYIGVIPSLQRKGLGAQLLEFVSPKADAAQARSMVNTSSEKGIKFYEASGWKNSGPVPVESPRGVAWNQYLMVRDPVGM